MRKNIFKISEIINIIDFWCPPVSDFWKSRFETVFFRRTSCKVPSLRKSQTKVEIWFYFLKISNQSWNLVLFFENLKPKLVSRFYFLENLNWKIWTPNGPFWAACGAFWPIWRNIAKFRAACGAFRPILTQYCQILGRLRRFLDPKIFACGAFFVKFLFFENLKPKFAQGFIFWKSQTKVGLKVLFFENLKPKLGLMVRPRGGFKDNPVVFIS